MGIGQMKTAQKAGGGSSSGLGEFWKMELAKNPDLSFPTRDILDPTDPKRLGARPNNFLASSEESEWKVSSSSDRVKTPSLDVLV